jgi:hypothetical protein
VTATDFNSVLRTNSSLRSPVLGSAQQTTYLKDNLTQPLELPQVQWLNRKLRRGGTPSFPSSPPSLFLSTPNSLLLISLKRRSEVFRKMFGLPQCYRRILARFRRMKSGFLSRISYRVPLTGNSVSILLQSIYNIS